ncbi:MAG: hypothetical protein E6R03_13670 [Hyphomicrobiaceae bacterium]|nr:MAG: hypothetical protein E6R03_13670 [Hyphomicrobiaceae bacterium]
MATWRAFMLGACVTVSGACSGLPTAPTATADRLTVPVRIHVYDRATRRGLPAVVTFNGRRQQTAADGSAVFSAAIGDELTVSPSAAGYVPMYASGRLTSGSEVWRFYLETYER